MERIAWIPFDIKPTGKISRSFLTRGPVNFHQAAQFVTQLPYGRNTDRSDYRLVLSEGRGTCSTKHALLASLCTEQQQNEIQLYTGIYEMTGSNTPGIGHILRHYGLPSIPEAHCYLKYHQDRWDFTRAGSCNESPREFLDEIPIGPHQIGDFKVAYHRAHLPLWLSRHGLTQSFDTDTLWKIREECIATLSAIR